MNDIKYKSMVYAGGAIFVLSLIGALIDQKLQLRRMEGKVIEHGAYIETIKPSIDLLNQAIKQQGSQTP